MRTLALRRALLLLLACILGVMSSGCAGAVYHNAPVRPPRGILFVSTKVPLTTNFNATPAGPALKKVSRSQTRYFRDFILTGGSFAWDEVAIAKIAKEGGIENISYADYELTDILGIVGTFTINVYGN